MLGFGDPFSKGGMSNTTDLTIDVLGYNFDHVKKIDENNIPSEILIGSDENGKANDIRALMDEYRTFLIETVDGGNISVEQSVFSRSAQQYSRLS